MNYLWKLIVFSLYINITAIFLLYCHYLRQSALQLIFCTRTLHLFFLLSKGLISCQMLVYY